MCPPIRSLCLLLYSIPTNRLIWNFFFLISYTVVVVQLLSCVWHFQNSGTAACQASCPSLSLGVQSNSCPLRSDVIQPSHPLLLPSPPALNLSQNQGLFQRVSSLHQVTKVLELQLQHQFFQWVFRVDFLWDWLIWSPWIPRDSQQSSITVQKHQFFSIQPSLCSKSHIHAWLLEKPKLWLHRPWLMKRYLCFLICCLSLS